MKTAILSRLDVGDRCDLPHGTAGHGNGEPMSLHGVTNPLLHSQPMEAA